MKLHLVLLAIAAALLSGPAAAGGKVHHVALQLSDDSADKMNLVLNNAANISQYYSAKGEEVEIRIVTFHGGVDMMRTDKSPVLARLKSVTESLPNVTFEICGNTLNGIAKRENKQVSEIPLFTPSRVVPAGIVELIDLGEQGWTIIRP
ncbi:MAG: hypothetical protein JOY81_15245 [Alphaproteobacteria bacterium]|nr:hypothetical protein [Alphaproteobacteria bacterium]